MLVLQDETIANVKKSGLRMPWSVKAHTRASKHSYFVANTLSNNEDWDIDSFYVWHLRRQLGLVGWQP